MRSPGCSIWKFSLLAAAWCLVVNVAESQVATNGSTETENAGTAITVQLRSDVIVSSRDVQLRDVASIRCRDPRLATQIGQLDIAALKVDDRTRTVSASFIRIRLTLAGWEPNLVSVDGPDTVEITFREPLPMSDADIETAALATMQTVLGTKPDELQVRLTSPFMQVLPRHIQEETGLRPEVLPPVRSQLGQVMLTVRLWKGRALLATRGARADVLRRQRVAVAKVSFRRDHVLTSSDVQFEQRFLSTVEDEPTEVQVIGRLPRRSVEPGEILSLRDLQDPRPQERPVVVKIRDNVRVTAVSGIARVTLRTAEAMQSGRVGDVIQVKNPDSDRIISGKVAAAGHVEIQLK